MKLNETHIQVFGLAMIFYVVVVVGFNSFFELITKPAKSEKIKTPIMSLEFVRKAKDVAAITENKPEAINGLKTFLLFDTFAFVPLYFGFLLVMSFFLSLNSFNWARTAAIIVVFAALIAAAADWTENYFSYRALDKVFSDPEEDVSVIYWAALLKWMMIFVSTGILSAIFWRGGLWNIAAILLLLSSLAGIVGLIFHPLINLSLLVQLFIILAVGLILMFSSFRTSFLQDI